MANELGYETVLYGTSDAIERLGINVEGYHPYLRLSFGMSNGNIDLIQYR